MTDSDLEKDLERAIRDVRDLRGVIASYHEIEDLCKSYRSQEAVKTCEKMIAFVKKMERHLNGNLRHIQEEIGKGKEGTA